MNDIPERDICDDVLTPPSRPADADRLRRTVLDRTSRLVRRRLWMRRAGLGAALAACYVAGVLTTRFLAPAPREVVTIPPPAEAVPLPEPSPRTLPAPAVEDWAARADDGERAALYRRAGDRYLDEESDPLAALRCYTKALSSGAGESSFSPEDNWLLMAIKNAREKEKRDAKNDS